MTIITPSKTNKADISFLKFLKPYLRPYKWQIAIASIALIVAASTVLFMGRGLQFLIDEGFGQSDLSLLDSGLYYLFVIVSILAVSSFTRYFFVSWVGERVIADIRKDVFTNLIRLSPEFYQGNKTGEILSHITVDTTVLQSVVGSSLSLALRNLLMMIGGVIMLLITSPKLTGFILLVIPVIIVPIIFWGRKVRAKSKTAQDAVANVGSDIDESLHGVTTIQSYVQEEQTIRSFNISVEKAYKKAKGYILNRAILSALVIFIVFSAIGIILWLGGRDVIAGTMSAGALSAFVFYAAIVAGAMGVLSEVIGNLQRAAGATERLIYYKSVQSSIIESLEPMDIGYPIQGALTFDRVTFSYPEQDAKILEGFNLSIKAGETVAIVGRSGAGKSTLFNLIMRFFDPQEGQILIDDIDLKDASLAQLRHAIGIVPQDPFIFSGSVKKNLLLAQEDASNERLIDALKQAYAYDFVKDLPQGLDTPLGERGKRLSGGQKQRLAIARTLLENPAILLLDEATSSLDSESEEYVKEALEKVMEGRTTLVIAHRLSTIMHVDRIVVLDHGKIVQMGTHQELIKQKGLYAELAQRQFS